MSAERNDFIALDWVAGELAQTLRQSAAALAEYLQNRDDTTRLRFCLSYIHQAHGTLRMVEFAGAALLAEEMEAAAQALLAGRVPDVQRDDALRALAAALARLPDYLQQLQRERRDTPVALLGLINDLRAVRGEPLITESAIFSPQFPQPAAAPVAAASMSAGEFVEVAKKLRQMYQLALLNYLRDKDPRDNLNYLAKVCARLAKLSAGCPPQALWQVCIALLEGLLNRSIEPGATVKALLRQLDGQLKLLTEQGPAALRAEPAPGLLKNMLYYVATSAANSRFIGEIKHAYNLPLALPAPDADPEPTLRAIRRALLSQLDELARTLELGEGGGLRQPFKRAQDAAALLGLNRAQNQLQDMARRLRGEQADLAALAASVRELAGTLDDAAPKAAPPTLFNDSEEAQEQLDQAFEAIVRESRNSLEQAKEAIIEFVATQWRHQCLEEVPDLLAGVRGGFAVAGLPRAARVLAACENYVRDELLGARRVPAWQLLDTLADAIASVDYYLERLGEDAEADCEAILDVAEDSVAALTRSDEAAAPAAGGAQVIPFPGGAAEPQPQAEAEPEPAIEAEAEDDAEDETRIDPEILSIFIEEAGEVLDVIDETLPGWREDPTRSEHLIVLRRSFHTLKGSGRMVGAIDIGELAWSIENLLNRVLDGSVRIDAPRVETVTAAAALVPAMVTAFEQGRAGAGRAVQIVMERAAAQAREQFPELPELDLEAEPEPPVAAEPDPVEPAAAAAIDDAGENDDGADDRILLDIFAAEALTHIETLERFIARSDQGGSAELSDDVQRALHTLKGSAHMADVTPIARIVTPVEKLVKELRAARLGADPDIVAMLAQGAQLFRAGLEQLADDPHAPLAGSDDFLQWVEALHYTRLAPEDDEPETERGVSPAALNHFLGEAVELLCAVGDDVRLWRDQRLAGERQFTLAGTISQVADNAEALNLGAVVELAQALQTLLRQGAEIDRPRDDFFLLATDGIECLIDMLDRLAANQQPDLYPSLLSALQEYDCAGAEPSLEIPLLDDVVAAGSGEWADEPGSESIGEPGADAERLASPGAPDQAVEFPIAAEQALPGIVVDEEPEAERSESSPGDLDNHVPERVAELAAQSEPGLTADEWLEVRGPKYDAESAAEQLPSASDEAGEQPPQPEPAADEWLAAHPGGDGTEAEPGRTAASSQLPPDVAEQAATAQPAADERYVIQADEHEVEFAPPSTWADQPASAEQITGSAIPSEPATEQQPDSQAGEYEVELAAPPAWSDQPASAEHLSDPTFPSESAADQQPDTQADEYKVELAPPPAWADQSVSAERITDPAFPSKSATDQQLDIQADEMELAPPPAWSDQTVSAEITDPAFPSESAADQQPDIRADEYEVELAPPPSWADQSVSAEQITDPALPSEPVDEWPAVQADDDGVDIEPAPESAVPEEPMSAQTPAYRTVSLSGLETGADQWTVNPVDGDTGFEAGPDAGWDDSVAHESVDADEAMAAGAEIPLLTDPVTAAPEQDRPSKVGAQAEAEVAELIDDWMGTPAAPPPTSGLDDEWSAAIEPAFGADVAERADAFAAVEPEVVDFGPPLPTVVDLERDDHADPRDVIEESSAEAGAEPAPAGPHGAADGDDEIDAEILEIFLEEAGDLLEAIEEAVHHWAGDRDNDGYLDDLQRLLHTLKGGARLAGLKNLGNLSHNFETLLINAQQQGRAVDDAFLGEVQAFLDDLIHQLEAVKAHGHEADRLAGAASDVAGETVAGPALADDALPTPSVEVELRSESVVAPDEPVAPPAGRNVVPFQRQPAPLASAREVEDLPEAETAPTLRRGPQEVVKISAQLLEQLVNLAGETSIARARAEEQVSEFVFALDEMEITVDRLQEQVRRLDLETDAQMVFRQEQVESEGLEGFDPLEFDRYSLLQQLSRSLLESASDLIDIKNTLGEKSRDMETLLVQQSRINTELQEGLMRSRLVPFARLVPRLRRIARQVAGELDKQVEFFIDNAEGELDRTVLERIVAPLEHMLRNAIDHGLETTAERVAAGKAAAGRVTLSLVREGGEVVLTLTDDGRGIDLDAVRRKAIDRGLMTSGASLSDHEVMQFILQSGFSTAKQVTQISGRGVGMDVVYSEIKQLGGHLEIDSEAGQGTNFRIRLPFTVSVNRALMVNIGGDLYAVPLNTIEGIVRVSPFELEAYYQPDAPLFEYAGQPYLMRYLGALLRLGDKPNLEGQSMPLPVLLVRGSDHSVAVQVDGLMGSREIVVKTLGPQFGLVQGLSGATVLGDGSVVVILDLLAMIRADALHLHRDHLPGQEEVSSERGRPLLVLVVDDSVTVRKVTSRFLERQGMEVLLAKDGVDAINLLQENERVPDVMLLDIEMPRMDGFEVASRVRHSARLAGLPIIMITSRTGEKHRDRAFSLGVNKYLGKPYQELVLLDAIHELTGTTATV